jgi:Cyclic nucleotide-binding domain
MRFDWFRGKGGDSIGELIAQRKYGKALEALRAQFESGSRSLDLRMQFADVLGLAGKAQEAVPILLGIAEELAAEGYRERAVDTLRKVENLDPGRLDVASKLATYTRQPFVETGTDGIEEAPIAEDSRADTTEPAGGGVASEGPAPVAAAPPVQPAEGSDGAAPAEPPPPPVPTPAEPPPPPVPAVASDVAAAGPAPAAAPTEWDAQITPSIPVVPPPAAPIPQVARATEATPAVVEAVADARAEGELVVETEPEIVLEPEPADPVASVTAAEAELIVADEFTEEEVVGILGLSAVPGPGAKAPPLKSGAGEGPEAGPSVSEDALEVVEDDGTAAVSAAEGTPVAAAGTPPGAPAAPPRKEQAAAMPSPKAASDEGYEVLSVESILGPQGEAGASPSARDESHDLARCVHDLARRGAPRPNDANAATPGDLLAALFGDLSVDRIRSCSGLVRRVLGEAEVVVREGDPGDSLFCILTGAAAVRVRSPEGREFQVAALREGSFFGEIAVLTGRPRSATVVAATRSELLEIPKATLDWLTLSHARAKEILEEACIARATSPEAAAVRAMPVFPAGRAQEALRVLEAYFGRRGWSPRMTLRLADLLVTLRDHDEVLPVMVGLAEQLADTGHPAKAIAIIQKVERYQRRDVEELCLAPLSHGGRKPAGPPPGPESPQGPATRSDQEVFRVWLGDLVRDLVEDQPTAGSTPSADVGGSRRLALAGRPAAAVVHLA